MFKSNWIAFVLQLSLLDQVSGLTCLYCSNVIAPRVCNRVVECDTDEVCEAQRSFNEFGEITYNLGCSQRNICQNVTSLNQYSPCRKCCDTDICNHVACGEQDYPSDIGPVCYNCQSHTPLGRCHDIEFCGKEQVCQSTGRNVFGDVLYTSQCAFTHTCPVNNEPSIIGKRDPARSSEVNRHCSVCCSSDLCNNGCIAVDGMWEDWTAWSNCPQTCDPAAITRSRSCDNPPPSNGGKLCQGASDESIPCQIAPNCSLIHDCSDLLRGNNYDWPSGVYHVFPNNSESEVAVLCDMKTDGGGWTIFQHRFDGSIDFNRSFTDYVDGFGSFAGEYWMGLNLLYNMASLNQNYTLRIDLSLSDGSSGYDVYSGFWIRSPAYKYKFNVKQRIDSINMTDKYLLSDTTDDRSMNGHNFSTYNQDNDNSINNCAELFGGGWWYNDCMFADLNGQYDTYYFYYSSFQDGLPYKLETSKMMFRPT